jgi:hypothetical protein
MNTHGSVLGLHWKWGWTSFNFVPLRTTNCVLVAHEPVILATLETDIRRSKVQVQPRPNKCVKSYLNGKKWVGTCLSSQR